MNQQIVVALELQSITPRTESFLGRDFAVYPAVLVRSQILHNNLGVTFLPAEDITDDWAQQWNGIPVLVGPHPSERGSPVSGRTPALWNERCAGWIFNAKARQESEHVRHLAGEIWLDTARAGSVDGLQSALDQLSIGQPVELSTGFTAQIVPTMGTFQGTAYEAIMHPADPDHLVISTAMTGACSVRDGCGLGVNRFKGNPPMENNTSTSTIVTEKKGIAGMLERVSSLFNTQRTAYQSLIAEQEEVIAARLQRELDIINQMPVSDQEKASRLRAALQEKFGSRGEVIVSDVFSDDSLVIFWLLTPLGPEPPGLNYFRASFSEEGGVITFSDPEKVRRVVGYEPAANEETADALHTATNCGCASNTEDVNMPDNKEGIEGQLASLAKTVGDLAGTVGNLATEVSTMKKAAETDPNPAIAGLKRTMQELAGTVESMATITKTAVQEKERERQSLIVSLAGNFRVPFTEAELETKPLVELQKLAEMCQVTNYTGRGGPRSAANGDSNEQRFVEPVPYWLVEPKNGGK